MILNHVKPHGVALRHRRARARRWPTPFATRRVFKKPVLGMTRTLHETSIPRAASDHPEFYADLDYNDDGGLIITRVHDAKDPPEAAAKCLRAIAEGKVTASVAST